MSAHLKSDQIMSDKVIKQLLKLKYKIVITHKDTAKC